jgi:hypothetical protein
MIKAALTDPITKSLSTRQLIRQGFMQFDGTKIGPAHERWAFLRNQLTRVFDEILEEQGKVGQTKATKSKTVIKLTNYTGATTKLDVKSFYSIMLNKIEEAEVLEERLA